MQIRVKRLLRTAVAETRGRFMIATGRGPGERGPFKVFVVGSGRSGTHWLGYILEAFPNTHVTVEKEPIFPWVVEMAQHPEREPSLFPRLAERYRGEHRVVLPKHYVDKSHPNLWIAERLAGEFPEARFVAIWRTLEGTVASMLKHDGVRHWVEAWDKEPCASRFLGVTEDMIPAYRRMSIAERCAVRVIAHHREIERLTDRLGGRLHVVAYESLISWPDLEVNRLADFLGLKVPDTIPMPKAESRSKWRTQLTDRERLDIRTIAIGMEATDLLDTRKAA